MNGCIPLRALDLERLGRLRRLLPLSTLHLAPAPHAVVALNEVGVVEHLEVQTRRDLDVRGCEREAVLQGSDRL